ncbi:MAG: cytochrome c, class I [Colwellia sp.]|nr:cytochrome c, class I [Colwellia sp.]
MLCSSQTLAADNLLKMNTDRAKFNYQMFCQGCHTPDGTGGKSVPKIKNYIGYFLQNQVAREYLVRVPGSANSSLNDEQLAEVLNWMIIELGGESVPTNMQYYTTNEVAKLRQKSLFEVVEYRKMLVKQLIVK